MIGQFGKYLGQVSAQQKIFLSVPAFGPVL